MLQHLGSRPAAAAAAAAAAAFAYMSNERIVEQQAARLDGLRDCAAHCVCPRTPASDANTLRSFDRPIVIVGLTSTWPALGDGPRGWSFAALRGRIGHALVDCGSSTGGVPFYLVAANAGRGRGRHDLALYVFDSDFSVEGGKACLLDDVSGLPSLSEGDVFAAGAAAEHDDRPVWRWLLAGPEGSGTLLHQDPWGYSSWNASVVGVKRWVLFPPTVPRETLHPPRTDALARAAACFGLALPRGAAAFMEEVLPGLRGRGLGEVELLQKPGEVVAFPAGWWHAVVNLDATIAVTESFGRPRDLAAILSQLRARGLTEFASVVEREWAASPGGGSTEG